MAQQKDRTGGQRDDDQGMAQSRPSEELGGAPGRSSESESQNISDQLGSDTGELGSTGRPAGRGEMEADELAGGAIGSPGRAGSLGEDELGISGRGDEGLEGLAPGEEAQGAKSAGDAESGGLDAEDPGVLDDDDLTDLLDEEHEDIGGTGAEPSGPRQY